MGGQDFCGAVFAANKWLSRSFALPALEHNEGRGTIANRQSCRGQFAVEPARAVKGKEAIFALVTTAGFLVLLKLILALCGIKPVLYADDPYAGFASHVPLFINVNQADGRTYMVTAANKVKWFNAQ